ncbi:MAG: hypothetical protein U1E76_02310 [Planctomycetota bacterium]
MARGRGAARPHHRRPGWRSHIDPTSGNGYYTFKERPFAISMFLFGFIVLWISLIILGTFLARPQLELLPYYPGCTATRRWST